MGASPRTEESMDSLASFFEDGHYHVALQVSAADEPLEEPPHQERDGHLSREEESVYGHHGMPSTAFPSPLAPAGPGMPQFAGRYVHDTADVSDTRPAPVPREVESRDLRAGVPRIPAPTAHQPVSELPSTLSSGRLSPTHGRVPPAPSRAPVIERPEVGGELPHTIPRASYGAPDASHGALPQGGPRSFVPDVMAPGPQSAGPMRPEPDPRLGHSELRTEGQIFAPSGRPQSYGPVVAGYAPHPWGFGGPPPAHPSAHGPSAGLPAAPAHGLISQGAMPYQAAPAFSGQRVPFQDMSSLHPSVLGGP